MTRIDYSLLEKYCYTRKDDHPNKVYSVVLADLLDKKEMVKLLKIYGKKIKARKIDVAAT
jgi:hypothetical protein